MRKLEEGQYDAIVLAAAGLKRLGWADKIAEILPAAVMCPAVGQGALAIETTAAGREACAALDHAAHASGGDGGARRSGGVGRRLPGADRRAMRHGKGGVVRLLGVVISPEGTEYVQAEADGPAAEADRIGRELGAKLLQLGAREILEKVYE